MNDYGKLAEDLGTIIREVEGLSVDDADTAARLDEAIELLAEAKAQAEARA